MKIKRVPVVTDVKTLHTVSATIDLRDKRTIEVVKKALLSTYDKLEKKAQGLAAIQCGLPYRAILLRYIKGEDPIIVFNPEIRLAIGNKNSNEGCISEGDQRYIVKRPRLCYIEYTTEDFKVVTKWITYRKARIFCHECDHLDGVLLQDKGILVED